MIEKGVKNEYLVVVNSLLENWMMAFVIGDENAYWSCDGIKDYKSMVSKIHGGKVCRKNWMTVISRVEICSLVLCMVMG